MSERQTLEALDKIKQCYNKYNKMLDRIDESARSLTKKAA